MARKDFVALPNNYDSKEEIKSYLSLVRENIELLTGDRGDTINHAVLRGDIDVALPEEIQSTATSSAEEIVADMQSLHATLTTLIQALKYGA